MTASKSRAAWVWICPLVVTIVNDDASVPPRLYSSVSPASGSVAATALPTFVPAAEFSGTNRTAISPSRNTGG